MLSEYKECIIVGASGEKKQYITKKIHLRVESQWERNESQISLYMKTAGRALVR